MKAHTSPSPSSYDQGTRPTTSLRATVYTVSDNRPPCEQQLNRINISLFSPCLFVSKVAFSLLSPHQKRKGSPLAGDDVAFYATARGRCWLSGLASPPSHASIELWIIPIVCKRLLIALLESCPTNEILFAQLVVTAVSAAVACLLSIGS